LVQNRTKTFKCLKNYFLHMVHINPPNCDDCDEMLEELNGEWYCENCDDVSGFELTPDDSSLDFEL
jgi:hypothetical protein